MVVILQALVCRPHYFRGRRGVWFIDNVAVLMTFIPGRSDSPDLERMSGIIHAFLLAYKTRSLGMGPFQKQLDRLHKSLGMEWSMAQK